MGILSHEVVFNSTKRTPGPPGGKVDAIGHQSTSPRCKHMCPGPAGRKERGPYGKGNQGSVSLQEEGTVPSPTEQSKRLVSAGVTCVPPEPRGASQTGTTYVRRGREGGTGSRLCSKGQPLGKGGATASRQPERAQEDQALAWLPVVSPATAYDEAKRVFRGSKASPSRRLLLFPGHALHGTSQSLRK